MRQVEDFVQLGAQVRHVRTMIGMSQADLASALGVDRSALSRMETGERKVTALEVVRLARAMSVTVPDLVTLPEPDVTAAREPLDEDAPDRDRVRARADLELDSFWRDAEQLRSLGLLHPVALHIGSTGLASVEEAEELARQTRQFLDLEDAPLPGLADVAARLGLWCRTTSVDVDGVSLSPEPGMGVALVGERLAPGRRRATLAHELAHHVSGDTYESSGRMAWRRDLEERAGIFAAEFLLPSSIMTSWHAPSREDLIRVATRYRVSWTLAVRALERAGGDSSRVQAAMVPDRREILLATGEVPVEDLTAPGLPGQWLQACALAAERGHVTAQRARELAQGMVI